MSREGREGEDEETCAEIPVKFSSSSRLEKSDGRGLCVLLPPREDMKREEVSGVCRLSEGPEGEGRRGRVGAELGGRPPLAMHTPLKRTYATHTSIV